MTAEYVDHLEECLRLAQAELERLVPLLRYVEHRPSCPHHLGTGAGTCSISCGLLEVALAAPPDYFDPAHYARLTVPRAPRKVDPWLRRHV